MILAIVALTVIACATCILLVAYWVASATAGD